MYSGWCPDQADAGRPGGQRRRLLSGFGTDRIYWGAQHFQWPLWIFRAVPAERLRYLVLLRDLGAVFQGEGLSYKPYPCGRPLHVAIDAALAARAQLQIERGED